MRRRRPRIERLRFRVFDGRAREALREMAAAHEMGRSGPRRPAEDVRAGLEARITAAVAGAEPLSSPLSSFVLERTGQRLSLRQLHAEPNVRTAPGPAPPPDRDDAATSPVDRELSWREVVLVELDLPAA
jgi:hypothetical protein